MARAGYFYSRTALPDIADGLNRIFTSQRRESGDSYVRSASSNIIVPVGSPEVLNELDEFLDELTVLQPSRFFVLVPESKGGIIKADITARCRGISSSQHVCCEVVRLLCPEERIAAVPEVLRANLIPGMPTRMLLYDGKVNAAMANQVLPMCEQTLFNSSDFEDRFPFVTQLAEDCPFLVDLQWVGLDNWRDQIKELFKRAPFLDDLAFLETVSVKAVGGGQNSIGSIAAWLMGGWFLERLKWEVIGYSGGGYDCHNPGGKMAKLIIKQGLEGTSSQLSSIDLTFHQGNQSRSLSFIRRETLEVVSSMNDNPIVSASFDDESRLGLYRRFFQYGEYGAGYPESLRRVVDLLGFKSD